MGKWIFLSLVVLAVYQYSNKQEEIVVSTVSANSIDSSCNVVIFTTASCPYCHKAKALLNEKAVKWCEYDINESKNNYALFKKNGGNGVPMAIIGRAKLHGFNKGAYLNAIGKI